MNQSNWLKHQWRVLAALLAFAFFAPMGLFTLPLAALLVMSRPHRTSVALVTMAAGGFSLAWVFQVGELPDQVVRAGAVIAVAVFMPVTFFTRSSVGHRVFLAGTSAVLSVMFLLTIRGRSWQELQWWVEHRMGHMARVLARSTFGRDSAGGVDAGQIADMLGTSVRFAADYHPALVTLQMMAGLALATVVYHRLAIKPRGDPPGRFRDFRFTEHLGWATIAALVVVLVPKFSAAKLGALNVLLVLSTLYALRGAAVAAAGLQQLGGGCVIVVLSVAAAFLMLPIAVVGAILLGIVDTSFDLRRRWQSPPAGG